MNSTNSTNSKFKCPLNRCLSNALLINKNIKHLDLKSIIFFTKDIIYLTSAIKFNYSLIKLEIGYSRVYREKELNKKDVFKEAEDKSILRKLAFTCESNEVFKLLEINVKDFTNQDDIISEIFYLSKGKIVFIYL